MIDFNFNSNNEVMQIYLLALSHLLDLTIENTQDRLSIFFIKDNLSKLC